MSKKPKTPPVTETFKTFHLFLTPDPVVMTVMSRENLNSPYYDCGKIKFKHAADVLEFREALRKKKVTVA